MSPTSDGPQDPATEYHVEPVEPDDLPSVMRLAWRTTSHLYPAPFFEEVARREAEHFRIVRETQSRKVVGFLIAAKQPGLTRNFFLLSVEPALIGQGLRRALIEDVEEILRREGVQRVSVEVAQTDADTLDLYRRQGFAVVGPVAAGDGENFEHCWVQKAL